MITSAIILLVVGTTIRFTAIYTLKNNAQWRLLRPTEIIQTGLYNYIRHPMYLGGLISYVGLCLLLTRSVGITSAFFATIINFILDRIDREEKNIIYFYGQKYLDYMKRTKTIIPFIF